MSAKYKLTENPPASAKNGIQNLHARIVPSRTATIDDLATEISTISTFSSGDIKGLLESFTQVVTNRLKNGENVNLDGLGYYSVSLDCPKDITSEKRIRAESMRFRNVNSRCSKKMKASLKSRRMERVPAVKKKEFTGEERLQRIISKMNELRTVTCTDCMGVNQCSRYIALQDLNTLIESGKIEKLGYGKNVLYMLRP